MVYYTTYIYGDLGDGLWHCFTHITVYVHKQQRFRKNQQLGAHL